MQKEMDRMDIFHKLFLVARSEQLHSALFIPNYDGPRILDLGTGTGIWAIDMAEYVVPVPGSIKTCRLNAEC
jgi:ubiquinone/menaquinone biosynthesis C-methylase UbiE